MLLAINTQKTQKMEDTIRVITAGKIYEMLEFVRRRHELVLTHKSITALQNFLNGYLLLNRYDAMYNEGDKNFEEFLLMLLTVEENIMGSKINAFSYTLLEKCNGDEEKAFDSFFELLEEFKSSK